MTLSRAILTAVVIGTYILESQASQHESSRLQVQIPQRLFKAGGYEHRGALFGSPPYGATIMQKLYYAADTLCDPTVDTKKGFPKGEVDPKTGEIKSWEPPFILMVDRGECPFVQKVRNAQHAGAAAVLIADNICVCNHDECIKANPNDSCESEEPIMANDGSGGDIVIPAMLMVKHDADVIKETIQSENVQIEMSWTIPTNEKVEYDIWSVPGDSASELFLRSWGKVAKAFEGRTEFTPHPYIFSGEEFCKTMPGTCVGVCTNNGKYCAEKTTRTVNDEKVEIDGVQVVFESLRRQCIWKHYTKDGFSEKYWKYIEEFSSRCIQYDYFSSKRCIADVYKQAGIDGSVVDGCIDNSGGIDTGATGEKRNVILDREINAISEYGITIAPTITVNSIQMKGALTITNVFDAVCAGYVKETAPEICKVCEECVDKLNCVNKGVCGSSQSSTKSKGVSKRFFGVTLLLLASFFGVAGFMHWKKTRQDMRDHVRVILAEYMPLEGAEGGDNEGGTPMDFARGGGTASLIE